ncbi:hypothetical protein PhCBS80983_g06052 [Powellomyces hirtus]|uniref:Uncharacterized protein n=1 Tax=Powellomyces hirtus TaxID=109895 RepID=A0A507DS95_9FUNG|nr:hypothetical protein PhCBS80983_g06052 [Powellomyces hirtus]
MQNQNQYALGQPLEAAAQCHAVAVSTTAATLETWHRCLGLLNHSERPAHNWNSLTKAEAFPSFKIFAAAAATETECSLKALQSDHVLLRHLSRMVLQRRMNRTLVQLDQCLVLQVGLPYKSGAAGKLIKSRDVGFDEESLAGDPGKPGEVLEDASEQGDKLEGGFEQGEDFEDAQEHQPSPAPQKSWRTGTGLLAEATCLLVGVIAPEEDKPASLKAARNAHDAMDWEQAAKPDSTASMPTTPGILFPCLQSVSS